MATRLKCWVIDLSRRGLVAESVYIDNAYRGFGVVDLIVTGVLESLDNVVHLSRERGQRSILNVMPIPKVSSRSCVTSRTVHAS